VTTGVPLVTEIIIGLLAFIAILGVAFLAFVVFFGGRLLQKALAAHQFPVAVPWWGTRMNVLVPAATARDVALVNDVLLERAKKKGYLAKDVKAKIDSLLVNWVKADPSYNGRAVPDPYGRKENDGSPMYLAGWRSGDHIFVVWKEGDSIFNTAYAHEVGHAIHETRGITDLNPADRDMWGSSGVDGIVQVSREAIIAAQQKRVFGLSK